MTAHFNAIRVAFDDNKNVQVVEDRIAQLKVVARDPADAALFDPRPNIDPLAKVRICGADYKYAFVQSGVLPMTSDKHIKYIALELFDYPATGCQTTMMMFEGAAPNLGALPSNLQVVPNAEPAQVDVCFSQGTLIATPSGDRPVETLKVGDIILNSNGDSRTVRWMSSNRATLAQMMEHPEKRPALIPKGCFGDGLPFQDLYVSGLHRIMLEGAGVETLFAERQVLCHARNLHAEEQVRTADWVGGLNYFHIMLDSHDLVFANGLPAESFYPTPSALDSLSDADKSALWQAFPELEAAPEAYGTPVLRTIGRTEAAAYWAMTGPLRRDARRAQRRA